MDMNDGETDFVSVKPHVEELNEVLEPSQTLKRNNCTYKRSFRRAQKRAAIHGYTWYKGKLCTSSSWVHISLVFQWTHLQVPMFNRKLPTKGKD